MIIKVSEIIDKIDILDEQSNEKEILWFDSAVLKVETKLKKFLRA